MASTSAITYGPVAGATTLPGLKVSPYGAVITNLKAYNFGVTSTVQVSATSTAINYTVSGLTTSDIPIALVPSTGALAGVGPTAMHVGAADTLTVLWGGQPGTSTGGIPGLTAPGAAYTLFTMSYSNQASSTTT
jgi:hypothetical protein